MKTIKLKKKINVNSQIKRKKNNWKTEKNNKKFKKNWIVGSFKYYFFIVKDDGLWINI